MDPRDFGVIPAMSGVVSMVQNSQKQLRVVCKQVDIVLNSQNHPKSHVLDIMSVIRHKIKKYVVGIHCGARATVNLYASLQQYCLVGQVFENS